MNPHYEEFRGPESPKLLEYPNDQLDYNETPPMNRFAGHKAIRYNDVRP